MVSGIRIASTPDALVKHPESLSYDLSGIPECEFIAPVVGLVEQFDRDRLAGLRQDAELPT